VTRVDGAAVNSATEGRRATTHRTRRGAFAMAATVLGLTLLATRMTPHPVGPARTYDKYRGKAVTTAKSALSAVETAALVARADARGDALDSFTAVVVSDAEESVTGVQSTFDSIQPPSARADDLRDTLDSLLTAAADHVATVRVSVRRGEKPRADDVHALDDDAKKLHAFAERNS
jgi:hypothetical protein